MVSAAVALMRVEMVAVVVTKPPFWYTNPSAATADPFLKTRSVGAVEYCVVFVINAKALIW
jgi:hypothetical protein